MALCSVDSKTDLCLLMVMGLPGAGKTSICDIICGHLRLHGLRALHLCYDAHVPDPSSGRGCADGAESATSSWKEQRSALVSCLELVVRRIWMEQSEVDHELEVKLQNMSLHNMQKEIEKLFTEALTASYMDTRLSSINSSNCSSSSAKCKDQVMRRRAPLVILLDDNFYYGSMRHAVYATAGRLGAACATLSLHVSVGYALLINSLRDAQQAVSEAVIRRMAERLERPPVSSWESHWLEMKESELGFVDAVGHCTDNNDIMSRIEVLIRKALTAPCVAPDLTQALAATAAAQEVCSFSSLHQADLVMRQLVAKAVEEDCEAGQQLAQAKKRYLVALRNGQVHIPLALNHLRNASQDARFVQFIKESFENDCKLHA